VEEMTLLQEIFDGLLGLGLLWLAWRSLACTDMFKAIVLFIAFGLLMALAWLRLEAPDVALAEAAIGAGVTGALLLSALAGLTSTGASRHEVEQPEGVEKQTGTLHRLPILLLMLTAALLGYAVLSLPSHDPGLSAEVAENLASSGVSNPVTAVLLNFRGYDTMLEMAVLLMALLGVWSLACVESQRDSSADPILDMLTRLLVPLLILVAAYLLWVGAHAPGGAFQAGSVLGAAGVLLILAGWRLPSRLTGWPLRLVVLSGPAAFVAIALITILIGGRLLEYPTEHAGTLILIIETMATLSIGVTLAALFLGSSPEHEEKQ